MDGNCPFHKLNSQQKLSSKRFCLVKLSRTEHCIVLRVYDFGQKSLPCRATGTTASAKGWINVSTTYKINIWLKSCWILVAVVRLSVWPNSYSRLIRIESHWNSDASIDVLFVKGIASPLAQTPDWVLIVNNKKNCYYFWGIRCLLFYLKCFFEGLLVHKFSFGCSENTHHR